MEFLLRIPLLHRLFGGAPTADDSRAAARARLKNALVGDRCTVAPGMSDAMQAELTTVLARYMDIDPTSLKLAMENTDGGMTWTAAVRVTRVHRQAHLPEAALREPRARVKRTMRGNRWRRSQEDRPSAEDQTA